MAVASLGATSNPARSFNLMLFAFAFSQAGELLILPKLSMNGIYWAFIICYAFGLLFIRWLPARPAGKVDSDIEHASIQQIQIPRFVPWMVLGAVLMTYINIGAYWTYIELASLDSDATPSWVSKVLVYTSFFSVLGCLFATVISKRFGLARPLLITLIIQGAVVLMLANGINDRNIIVSLFSFNFLWIFIDVYQMATVANVDPAGRYSALLPGAQGLGQIIGPNLAASILAAGFGYGGVFVMCAAASAVAMLIYLAMYLKLKRVSPELADAS
ncbi:MAG: YbfB/YjiJ family MFS transporter [Pseudomonadota bacterium]